MHSDLLLVNKDGKTKGHLHPILPKERIFDETWLQELLISNPDLLPIRDIDINFDHLIPLGREVTVSAGSIDDLYVTSDGFICLVETKLWRNPEAHRTVVAQIIDYAKDLSKMSFDEFKEAVEKSQLRKKRIGFWERVSGHIEDISQIEFQNKLQNNLIQGKFLLLIVGDKIYPEVAMLVDAIQSAPNLEFKIAMVEINLFKTSKDKIWPLVVIPKVVGKTCEVVRSVVRIIYEEKKPEVKVASIDISDRSNTARTDKKTFESSISEGYADLFIPVIDKWISDGFVINWGKMGFSVRFLWKNKLRSIIDIYPDSISLLTEDMMRRRKLPLEPYQFYKKAIDRILVARQTLLSGRRYIYYRDMSIDEFKQLIDATDEAIRNFKKLEIPK